MTLLKEETMLVHPVVIPGSGTRSWTVLGDDDVPVVPVDRFLAYLTDIGRSPNPVRAYAHDLKDYWSFIGFRGLDWREARLEDVGEFVAWLQLPPACRAGEVAVLPSVTAEVSASTVNRKLATVRRVLCPSGPQRGRGRRSAGRVAGRRAGRLEAVPAPCQQGAAVSRAGDLSEVAEEAAADPVRRRDAGDPRTRAPGCGTASSSPCFTTAACFLRVQNGHAEHFLVLAVQAPG